MGIKQQLLLSQLVTGNVKWLFLWAQMNFGNGHESKALYCEINRRDACREPASPLSRRNEMHMFPRASAFSRLKGTRAFNLRVLYLDERAKY
jgi:hypothetical protein